MHSDVRAVASKLLQSSAEDLDAATADAAVRGAFVSILSRAFSYGEAWMVPMLDGLNHQSAPNVFHFEEAVGDCEDDDGDDQQNSRIAVRAKEPLEAGAEVINMYSDGADYAFGCDYGFFDTGGIEEPNNPLSWTAASMRRRSGCSVEIEVAGLSFGLNLRQIDYLRLTEAGIPLAAAAARADLTDLVACAELAGFADSGPSGPSDAVVVLQQAAAQRAVEMADGRAVAEGAIARGDVSSDRVDLAAKLRRSEEVALEALTDVLDRCRARMSKDDTA